MKTQLSPVAAVIGIVVAVLVIGTVIWFATGGKSFSKDEVSGNRMGGNVDLNKLNEAAAASGQKPSGK